MFYAHFVLAKKGPLARIWLAAHWDKKLTKAHVFETNIEKSVEGILQPKVKMALRTSGHLLLGVVRIYSRKAKYLLADCNEAFVKIKMAFRPGVVDLPESNREAAVNAITLPEVFHNFDTAVPESSQEENVLDSPEFNVHQTRAEEITMREDYIHMDSAGGSASFMTDLMMPSLAGGSLQDEDDDDEENQLRHHTESDSSRLTSGTGGTLFDEDEPPPGSLAAATKEPHTLPEGEPSASTSEHHHDILFNDEAASDQRVGGLYDEDDDDLPFGDDDHINNQDDDEPSHLRDLPQDDDPPSPLLSSRGASPAPSLEPDKSTHADTSLQPPQDISASAAPPPTPPTHIPVADQTTLIRDEEESFALAPVDASAIRGTVRTKRKRKLIVDEVKAIAGEEMKAQLSDTADIVTTLDLAPPTKRLMHWKETGGVEKLFALPGRPLNDSGIFKFYQSRLTARPSDNEDDFGLLGDSESIMLDNVPGAAANTNRAESPFEPVTTPRRAPRKRKAVTEESPSKRAQREEDEAAALAQAEAYRREQQAMMNNSDMYDTSHLLQKQREEEEAANETTASPSWKQHQPEDDTSGAPQQTDFNASDPSQPPAPSAPSFTQSTAEGSQFDNLGFNNSDASVTAPPDSDPHNMSWDANNGSPGGASMGGPPSPPDHSDDDGGEDDYGPSSSPVQPEEEMGEEETIEEFEDRVLNKRALQLSNILKNKFETKDNVIFNSITRGNGRKQAAQKFYSMLVLQKMMALEVLQPGSHGDISIVKGPKFDTAVF